ncbi:MAG: thiamine phosphate synthase [Bacteroidales bacterium]|mgnify:CR=1 FL=1|nr:thiamine phosphate synthase [Bacteroidales bacterium]
MIIGITQPTYHKNERERITDLLQRGKVDYFHIRKPSFSKEDMADYLAFFPMETRQRLSLHSFHELSMEMGIGGVHLNKSNPELKANIVGKRVSASCHSIEEFVERKAYCDYCFLSPVFDSISKKGYKSKLASDLLKQGFKELKLDSKCVALGGVTKERIPELQDMGFTSFAMLSDIWAWDKTMFITHTNENYSYLSSALTALEGGIRFIQLRMKEAEDDEVLKVAEVLRQECDKVGALLTIDDRVHLLNTGLFDGVHIGKNDMPIEQARKLVPDNLILGSTANTLEDILSAVAKGVDYIGLGPFRFTTTKKNLSTILGLEGYRQITQALREKNIQIPIYAIGGIRVEDLKEIKNTDVYGVALSSVILESAQPMQTIKEITEIF